MCQHEKCFIFNRAWSKRIKRHSSDAKRIFHTFFRFSKSMNVLYVCMLHMHYACFICKWGNKLLRFIWHIVCGAIKRNRIICRMYQMCLQWQYLYHLISFSVCEWRRWSNHWDLSFVVPAVLLHTKHREKLQLYCVIDNCVYFLWKFIAFFRLSISLLSKW